MTSYVLIVDIDADRIDAAVRGCGDAFPVPALVVRDGDEATRIIEQFGPPALLMTALGLPGRDGLSVIDAVRCVDGNAAVIAWTDDRGIREYAANRLAQTRAKVLGRTVSPAVCRRCVDGLLVNGDEVKRSRVDVREEDWADLVERARERFGVTGAAAYTKVRGTAEYRLSVSWTPDAPISNVPARLSSALEEVIASGSGRMWTDLVDGALRSLAIVPILRDGGTAGALCVFDSEPHVLGHDDLEGLNGVVNPSDAGHHARSVVRSRGPSLPMDRDAADAIIQRELARVRPDHQPLSLILFAATTSGADDSPAIGDILAGLVRGNDVVIRWTSSEVLVVLTGVGRGVARRVAKRIGGAVESKSADKIAIAGAVTELRTADSFEDTVARAAERLQPSTPPQARRRNAQ